MSWKTTADSPLAPRAAARWPHPTPGPPLVMTAEYFAVEIQSVVGNCGRRAILLLCLMAARKASVWRAAATHATLCICQVELSSIDLAPR